MWNVYDLTEPDAFVPLLQNTLLLMNVEFYLSQIYMRIAFDFHYLQRF